MTTAKGSNQMNREPKISDPWMLGDQLDGCPPENEILCRFDFYQDGDWKQAPRAALVALENGLPIPDWALPEVKIALRNACGLPVLKRRRGRHARGQAWKDHMNQQAQLAALNAVEECGIKGKARFEVAKDALNREGVPTAVPTLQGVFKKRNTLRKRSPSYSIMVPMFIETICSLKR